MNFDLIIHVLSVAHSQLTPNCYYSTEDVRNILYDVEEILKKESEEEE